VKLLFALHKSEEFDYTPHRQGHAMSATSRLPTSASDLSLPHRFLVISEARKPADSIKISHYELSNIHDGSSRQRY
jgi:hypothetical protein